MLVCSSQCVCRFCPYILTRMLFPYNNTSLGTIHRCIAILANRGISHDNIHCSHRGISHDNIHCSLKPRCTNWSASVNRDHFVTCVQLQLQSKAGSRAFAPKRHNLHCDAQVGAENKSTWSLKINAHDGILSFRTSRIIITRVPENAYFRS